MKKILAMMPILGLLTASASADFFSPGEPNGWDNTTPMTDVGGGIWEYTWTGFVDDVTVFDILSEAGNWDSKVHSAGNQWVTPDASDGNTLSLDTNFYDDGWFPQENRVGVASESIMDWTAVGDWQNQVGGGDWDNANPSTAMADMGGGIFSIVAELAPGTYQYKAVHTGTWDAIGGNSRNVNADNFSFTTDAVNNVAEMYVNVLDGTVKVVLTPAPSSLALFGLAGLMVSRRR